MGMTPAMVVLSHGPDPLWAAVMPSASGGPGSSPSPDAFPRDLRADGAAGLDPPSPKNTVGWVQGPKI